MPKISSKRVSRASRTSRLSKLSGGGKRRIAKRTGKRTARRTGRKRPLNAYFKQMLSAEKNKLSSFTYKGKKYNGRKHPRLGMIYKKA